MDENVKYLSVIPNAGEQLSVTFMGNVNHRNLNGLGVAWHISPLELDNNKLGIGNRHTCLDMERWLVVGFMLISQVVFSLFIQSSYDTNDLIPSTNGNKRSTQSQYGF